MNRIGNRGRKSTTKRFQVFVIERNHNRACFEFRASNLPLPASPATTTSPPTIAATTTVRIIRARGHIGVDQQVHRLIPRGNLLVRRSTTLASFVVFQIHAMQIVGVQIFVELFIRWPAPASTTRPLITRRTPFAALIAARITGLPAARWSTLAATPPRTASSAIIVATLFVSMPLLAPALFPRFAALTLTTFAITTLPVPGLAFSTA